jgi:S1-C subfamily serine protease
MKAQFTFQSGSRAGQIDVLSQAFILVGRHPQCELRFDPDQDLDVSARHASVSLNGELYVLRDLGSTNGTFVNGRRLTGDHVLATKDVIQFGTNGPRVTFASIPDPPPAVPAEPGENPSTTVFPNVNTAPTPQAAVLPPPKVPMMGSPGSFKLPRPTPGGPGIAPPIPTPKPGATTRVRIEVQKQTRKHRQVQLLLFGLLILVTIAYFWSNSVNQRQLAAQRRVMLGAVDSLMAQIATLSGTAQSLQGALDSAQAEASRLRAKIDASGTSGAEIDELRNQLLAATRQQKNLAQAAALDAAAISAANRDAIAMVFVQFKDGRTYTGTGFGVRSDPNGGLVVTNRHVVVDSGGNLPEKVGVVFNGSNQNFRADVVEVSQDADLATIRTTVHRGIPVVKAVAAANAQVGEPIAIMGFPLGLDLKSGEEWHQLGVAATLTLGTVSRLLPDLLQLDSYGAQGSSGSPIFNRQGEVTGVLYGGEKGSNGRIVYAVPVDQLRTLLAK